MKKGLTQVPRHILATFSHLPYRCVGTSGGNYSGQPLLVTYTMAFSALALCLPGTSLNPFFPETEPHIFLKK